jgi:phage tail protein X
VSTINEVYTIEAEGITVSLLIWRRFHRAMPGLAERVYDLNRGLGDLPIILPVGTVITIPVDTPGKTSAVEREPVQLWS